jgi:hypothetical protein
MSEKVYITNTESRELVKNKDIVSNEVIFGS